MAKRILNTLYITTQGAYVHKKGDTVVVEFENQILSRVPLINLGGIICFGNIRFSPFLLGAAAEENVRISFLTENGYFLANVNGKVSGNVLVRREQYRAADDPGRSLLVAQAVIGAKIANSRTVIRRAARESGGDTAIYDSAAESLTRRLRELAVTKNLDSLRGVEGEAAAIYFSVFDNMIRGEKPAFSFSLRNRRPPTDRVNALISFLYTLVMHDISAALETHGLDPSVGFLHRDRPGRASLSLDILEEFRAPIADRIALTLINRKQVTARSFEGADGEPWTLKDDARKAVLIAYQKRKQDIIHHPFLEEDIPIGLIFNMQALLLARWLRGDLDAYPSFLWK